MMSEAQAQTETIVSVSHVAEQHRRYPGEVATFFTRVEILENRNDLTVRVNLPQGFEPLSGWISAGPQKWLATPFPTVEVLPENAGHQYVWRFDDQLAEGARLDFITEARIQPVYQDLYWASQAIITGADLENYVSEAARIEVKAKGEYLKYLPALYGDDDFMGRFLMLFESFLAPIDQQIDHLDHYFDPRIAPEGFVEWLSSWFDLSLGEEWPEEKRRQLILSAVALFRKRGTRQGLQDFLEIYTGVRRWPRA